MHLEPSSFILKNDRDRRTLKVIPTCINLIKWNLWNSENEGGIHLPPGQIGLSSGFNDSIVKTYIKKY